MFLAGIQRLKSLNHGFKHAEVTHKYDNNDTILLAVIQTTKGNSD
jgi:hypothetical protein